MVDANSYYARPGPRVVEGTELLAHLIHPDLFSWNGPEKAYQRLETAIAQKTNASFSAGADAVIL